MSRDGVSLFVYGTLKRCPGHPLATELAARALKGPEPAWVRGRIFDLGPYPALVLGGGRAFGELWRLRPGSGFMKELDRYEGCSDKDPEPQEYGRQRLLARLEGERLRCAWAYVYRWPLSPGASAIAGGRYLGAGQPRSS